MRPAVAIAAAALGCATSRQHIEETSPRFAELAPRRIGVVVAGEEPRDAQARIDRFGLRYPDPIGPDTRLPAEAGLAHALSHRFADGLVAYLRLRGYQAEALDAPHARVGDLLRPARHDALLVVVYRSASRWPVSEYQRTEIQQIGSIQQEVSHYLYTIENGLLILPTAHLLDTRTSLRLWSHSNYGLQSDRVAMDDPVRKLGVIVKPEHDPPPDETLVPEAMFAVLSFYFDSLPAAPSERPAPGELRAAELRDEAAVDRWRMHRRLVLDAGGGYARRAFSVGSVGSLELDSAPAFSGYWDVEVGLRVLGRQWIHGARLAFLRSSADYERIVLDSTALEGTTYTRATLRSVTSLDLAYTLARVWQPRRPALLTAGLGPGVTVAFLDGDEVDHAQRVQIGPVAEVEALWAGEIFLAGPFVRAGWMFDLTEGGSARTLTLGARLAATF